MIDMASVYAERFKQNPRMLQAAVMGQSPDPKLDPYTALNALRLIKESNAMAMAGKAQQPTSAPSILAETMAPPAPSQGLAGMMPMGAPAGQMPQPQQAPIQQASGGLAGMPVHEQDYAGGGIVAFAGDENNNDPQTGQLTGGALMPAFSGDGGGVNDEDEGSLGGSDDSAGNLDAQAQFNQMLMQQMRKIGNRTKRATSPADAARQEEEYYQRELRRAGPDIYAPEIARGEEYETDRRKSRNSSEAMALLTAAGKILKGHNLAMGASEALPAYAQQMNEAERADAAAKSANAKMQFALKDAQRKERVGNSRAAQASMELYRRFEQDENKAEFERDNAVAQLAAKGIVGNRPTGKGAGAGGPKLNELAFQANVDNLKATTKPKPGESPEAFDARIRSMAAELTTRQTKTSFSTADIGNLKADMAALPSQVNIDTKINDSLQKFKTTDSAGSAYRAALRKDRKENTNEAGILLQAEEDRLRGVFRRSEAGSRAPNATAAPTAKPTAAPTATGKVLSQADFEATIKGSIARGKTRQEAIDALKANGYTIR